MYLSRMKPSQRAREILRAEAQAILNVPLSDEFDKVVNLIARMGHRKVLLTGMGKAGNIARKVTGTLCSTGTPACFLHPGEAAHGDLGLVSPGDLLLAFSTSGKTREVLETIQLARRLGASTVVAVTSHPDAPIRNLADYVLELGEIEEPCYLGLTPTASTTAMLALGDALALCIMGKNNISKEDYGLRHHGGYLGEIARE